MAYFSQEDKKKRAPVIKKILKKYDMKATMSVRNHSTFIVTLKSGALDFGENKSVNVYWIDDNYKDDKEVRNFLTELKDAMLGDDYFDHSDIMTDYFHCSHYIDIKVGKWDKPYVCTSLPSVEEEMDAAYAAMVS